MDARKRSKVCKELQVQALLSNLRIATCTLVGAQFQGGSKCAKEVEALYLLRSMQLLHECEKQ